MLCDRRPRHEDPVRAGGFTKAAFAIASILLMIAACASEPVTPPPGAPQAPVVKRQPFGTVNGAGVESLTLTNANGVEVTAITYGGIITSIKTPDRHGLDWSGAPRSSKPEGSTADLIGRWAAATH